ncbi:MAG: hypothetical protein FGM46_05785 [Ferruginibacter sp.]|nr:hypothetical protein [Ferruginibacter sp.]
MKKLKLLSIAMIASSLMLASCGGNKDKEIEAKSPAELLEEANKLSASLPQSSESSTSTSSSSSSSSDISIDELKDLKGKDALDAYKSAVEQYDALIKESGNSDAAKTLKSKLDQLKSIYNSSLAPSELKALGKLTEVALSLESGKTVDLSQALGAYESAVNALDKLENVEDAAKVIKGGKEVLDAVNEIKDNPKGAIEKSKELLKSVKDIPGMPSMP